MASKLCLALFVVACFSQATCDLNLTQLVERLNTMCAGGTPAARCTCLRNNANKDIKPGLRDIPGKVNGQKRKAVYTNDKVFWCDVDKCECSEDLKLVDPREVVMEKVERKEEEAERRERKNKKEALNLE